MDFMVPAGVRLDLADGTLCLPDEVRIHLSGRRPTYGAKIQNITTMDQHVIIPAGESREVKAGIKKTNTKLWITRGPAWVPTVIAGLGRMVYLKMTNISDCEIVSPTHVILGMWMAGDMLPRAPGYVSAGSRRYREWQTLAYEATVDRQEDPPEEWIGPLVDHPEYATPTQII